jgi:hypothetical protein
VLDYHPKTALAIGIVHLKTYRTEMTGVCEDGYEHQEGVAGRWAAGGERWFVDKQPADPAGRQYEPAGRKYDPEGRQYDAADKQYESTGRQYGPAGRRYDAAGRQYDSTGRLYGLQHDGAARRRCFSRRA